MRVSEEVRVIDKQRYKKAVEHLKHLKEGNEASLTEKAEERDEVFSTYGNFFKNPSNLSEQTFQQFLSFKENKHWKPLQRGRSKKITKDMKHLIEVFETCLDETKPIEERINIALGNGKPEGLGKGILTACLLVATEGRYAVWNNTSEDALNYLGIYPKFPRGTSTGSKYKQINELIKKLSKDVSTDLWTLDWLFWVNKEKIKLDPITQENSRRRKPSLNKSTKDQIRKSSERNSVVRQRHNKLQNKLFHHLRSIHGDDKVTMEENYIDVKVEEKAKTTLYEVKVDKPISCIRQGLGQVLSYGWFHTKEQNKAIKLVVVGPNAPTEEEKEFVGFIKKNLRIDFEYQQCP